MKLDNLQYINLSRNYPVRGAAYDDNVTTQLKWFWWDIVPRQVNVNIMLVIGLWLLLTVGMIRGLVGYWRWRTG